MLAMYSCHFIPVQVTLVAITARMLNETVNPSPLHQNTKFQATHLPQELVFPLGTGRSLEEPLQKYHGDTESHTSHQNSISVEDSKEGSLFQMVGKLNKIMIIISIRGGELC